MCALMNLFYCVKALRGNAPACFDADPRYRALRHLPALRTEPAAPAGLRRAAAGGTDPLPVPSQARPAR